MRPWLQTLPAAAFPEQVFPPMPGRLVYAVTAGERADLEVGRHYAAGTALCAAGQPQFLPLAARLICVSTETLVFAPEASHPTGPEPASLPVPPAPMRVRMVRPGIEDLIERARTFGIAGHGGAGFPLWKKLEGAQARSPSILVVNAVECEPGLAGDGALLALEPERVARGFEALVHVYSPQRALLAAHTSEPARRLGCEALVVPGGYPAGDERQICRQLGRPLGYRERSLDAGVLMLNVGTVAALGDALDGIAPNRRFVTVHGPAVARPSVLPAWLGTPLNDVLEAAAMNTALADDRGGSLGLRVGGLMMGTDVAPAQWRADEDAISRQIGVAQSTTGLYLRERLDASPAQPCINCQRCDAVCPQHLPVARLWQALDRQDAQATAPLLDGCNQCRCCDLVCPSGIGLADAFGAARLEVGEQARAAALANWYAGRYQAHQRREQERNAARERRRERRDGSARPQLADLLKAGRRRRRRPGV
ncbi:MAG: hypothetical protein AAF458_17870 [Pseudomonadota bacterium]